MKINKNLAIIGMMGSGKSTIGRLLAKKINAKFIDIDQTIEDKLKMKIIEIFEKKGEFFFRQIEEKTTLELLDKTNSVISLGGGAFLNKKIQKEIEKKCVSIWLNWSSKTLIKRIRKNNKRPVILNLNNIELKKLIFERSKTYSKSNYRIDCEKMNKIEIVKKIVKIYEAIQN